jgi:hypothetical protein
MTDRNKALQELLAKVEDGEWNSMRDEPHENSGLLDYWHHFDAIMDRGSLDAAKALHDAVLPDYEWTFYYDGECSVQERKGRGIYFTSIDKNPARAWLIAILRALIATKDGL